MNRRLIAVFLVALLLMALLVPLVSFADTEGIAVAVLFFEPPPDDEEPPEEEVAGGGGAIECIPFCAPPLPALYASKYSRWVEDNEAAGQTNDEKTLRYVVTLENVSPVVVEDILYVEVLDPHLRLIHDAFVAPGAEKHIYSVADTEAITVSIPSLAPEETYELQFAVRVAEETLAAASVLLGQGIVYAEGSSPVLTDDPTTEPLQDATRTIIVSGPSVTVGQATDLAVAKTATVIEEKEAFRVVDLGGVVEYDVVLTNTSSEAMSNVCVYDVVGPHLYVDPESLRPTEATVHSLGPISVVTAEFPELVPGQSGVLRYQTEIGYDMPAEVTYTCSRAMATTLSAAGFSDDPATWLADDPTAVLFPYRCSEAWDWHDWLKLISSAPTGLWPLVNREISGEELLHWVLYGGDFFGDVSAHPAVRNPSWPERALVGLVEMPNEAASKRVGFRLTHREEAPVCEFLEEEPLLLWSVYGLPVYGRVPLTDTGDLLWLEGVSEYEFCDEGYLPLLVDLQEAYDWRMAWLEDYMIYATVLEETVVE